MVLSSQYLLLVLVLSCSNRYRQDVRCFKRECDLPHRRLSVVLLQPGRRSRRCLGVFSTILGWTDSVTYGMSSYTTHIQPWLNVLGSEMPSSQEPGSRNTRSGNAYRMLTGTSAKGGYVVVGDWPKVNVHVFQHLGLPKFVSRSELIDLRFLLRSKTETPVSAAHPATSGRNPPHLRTLP